MLGKVFPLVIVLAMGAQAEDNLLSNISYAEPSLDTVRRFALWSVTHNYDSTMDQFNYCRTAVSQCESKVKGNIEMKFKVKSIAEMLVGNITIIADKLIEEGKASNRSDSYFECVGNYFNSSMGALQKGPSDYESTMVPHQNSANVKIGENLFQISTFMEILADAMSEFTDRLDKCDDFACIDSVVRAALSTHSNVRSISIDLFLSALKETYNFMNLALNEASMVEDKLQEAFDAGVEGMRNC